MRNVLQLFKDALSISELLYKENKQLWEKWNSYYVDVKTATDKIVTSEYFSPSFSMLVQWLEQQQKEGVSSLDIFKNLDVYKVKIHELIGPFIAQEFCQEGLIVTMMHMPANDSDTSITHINYLEINNSAAFYKLRDEITKNQFEEDANTNLKSYTIETKDSNGESHLSFHKDKNLRLTNINEAIKWSTLVDNVMTNMDDLTMDCLDTILIQWLNKAKSPNDFIDFSYEKVQEMCGISKSNGIVYHGVEDKIKIVKRIGALASIFLLLNAENEIVIRNDCAETGKHYEVKREVLEKLFVLDSVVLWRDKNTNEYMGIESCRIKPGRFLSNCLFGSKSSTILVSKKALEYNSNRHKYHKRLIRYLTWQWRIRQKFSCLQKPYSIGGNKGLLAIMGINQDQKPNRIREQLEKILTDLEKETVISHWEYNNGLEEEQLTKKNWFQNYYSQLELIIIPVKELVFVVDNLTKKKTINKVYETSMQIKNKEKLLVKNESEELIRAKIEFIHRNRNITMRELSIEIGISQPTLFRFFNKKTKRLSGTAREKLNQWYKKQLIIDQN
ncbi:XRE family transcriptional regulator [Bacillus sp. TD10]|uniref:XRE family transcriptional regulator n=1 Tax=Bacillus sp. TD10 TaxID=1672662 RepID=UPI00391C85F8